MAETKRRIAIIVSHPIQYYAPLYQRLAKRDDVAIKVFFTWHAGKAAVEDRGFKKDVAWDIPLTEGYDFELVPNISRAPGTHRFFGLRNPTLVEKVLAWQPDVVHITGWAWYSHFMALHAFYKKRTPTLFRGDSHLLELSQTGPRWWVKRTVLQRVYSWPTGFLVTGTANRAYYEAFGVNPERLHSCPHSIDVARFAEPAELYEREAAQWREQMGISRDRCVFLFAGKFERKKRPLELMRAVQTLRGSGLVLVMVGSGELDSRSEMLLQPTPIAFVCCRFKTRPACPWYIGSVIYLCFPLGSKRLGVLR